MMTEMIAGEAFFEMRAAAGAGFHDVLAIMREPVRAGRWDPVARPRPASAWADIYPAMWAAMANGAQRMTADDKQDMMAYYRLANLNVRQGSASEETWACLALGTNLALVLTELGYAPEYAARIVEAQDGLLRARERGDRTGSFRLDGPGMAAVSDAIDVLDAQLDFATRREVIDARDIVLERIELQSAALDLLENG